MSRFSEDLRAQYIETVLWADTYAQNDEGEIVPLGDTTLDGYVDCWDVETQLPTFADDVETFYSECFDAVSERFGEDSEEFETFAAITPSRFAHDFALSRNRQGAGFWDRGLGDLGDFLTDLAVNWGEATLEVWLNEDGDCIVATP